MSNDANSLIFITKKLILPLSRDVEHPLGTMLLDEFLLSFSKPAKRDLYWSVPILFSNSCEQKKWQSFVKLNLEDEEYILTKDDVYKGCPSIYLWALSSLDNTMRKYCRDSIMRWAKMAPMEFYKLFLKYASINDPQIRSDLFSILFCLIYNGTNVEIIKSSAEWILQNILHPNKIFSNSDVSIR